MYFDIFDIFTKWKLDEINPVNLCILTKKKKRERKPKAKFLDKFTC